MKKTLNIPFFIGSFSLLVSLSYSDPIEEIINNVNLDTLIYFVECLSGEREVEIEGKKVKITSREKGSNGNTNAELFIASVLEKYSLNANKHEYSSTGTNVYAIQSGRAQEKFIFCAHFDGAGAQCPAADDNASSTATVLEAARIISKYSVTTQLQYALWDEEEQTMVGSGAYAKKAKSNDEIITGVINMDMLGYDGNNDGKININHKANADAALLNETKKIHKEYGIKLDPVVPSKPGPSDHTAFWDNGFKAIGVEEDWDGKDQNPNYHKPGDRVNAFNKTYYHEFAKLMIGTIASLVGAKDPSVIAIVHSSQNRESNYLHFTPMGNLMLTIQTNGWVALSVLNAKGQTIGQINDYYVKGHHTIQSMPQLTDCARGVFIYSLTLNNKIVTKNKISLP